MSDRYNVFPSEAVKKAMKDRLSAARSGLKLLKKKSDALKVKLHAAMKQLREIKDGLGDSMKDAYYSHSQATWSAGSFNAQVQETVGSRASFRVRTTLSNFSGVKIPSFNQLNEQVQSKDQAIGVARGGLEIKKCRDHFVSVLQGLIKLASLQTSITTLDTALKVTNRRVNALEFVIIPRLVNTLSYIESELDEGEREDQNRIKKVKALREEQSERDAEAARAFQEAERLARLMTKMKGESQSGNNQEQQDSSSSSSSSSSSPSSSSSAAENESGSSSAADISLPDEGEDLVGLMAAAGFT